MDKSSIALLSTVINFNLYSKTAPLFPSEITKYIIDGTNGMHGIHSIKYMFSILKNKGIDWLIMADEDVVFLNPDLVFELIQYMQNNQFMVCGVRDGGVIAHRNCNPYLINTFFSIIHFSAIEKLMLQDNFQRHQYIVDNEFEDDLSQLPYTFDTKSLFEPYYCFYLWLRRKQAKFLFLDSKMEADGIANSVFFEGKKLLTHTWYARSYGVNEKHTHRINQYLENIPVTITNLALNDALIFKKTTFAWEQKCKKLLSKISYKIQKIISLNR